MKHITAGSILATPAIVLTLLSIISPAGSAPKPSEVPTSWELDIDVQGPRPIEVTLPGATNPERFWYLRYTVSNRTGADRIFVPESVLYTDTGQVIQAGRKVPTTVFKAIKKRYNDPLLLDMTGVTGKLLQGEDNAKNGVAIWGDFDPKAGSFDIFIGGLSGETVEVKLPRPIVVSETDATGKTQQVTKTKVVLAKTMCLTYAVVGEAAARRDTRVKQVASKWVMR